MLKSRSAYIIGVLLLLMNMCYPSQRDYYSIDLIATPFLPIDKDSLSILSSIIRQKNEHKENQLKMIRASNCSSAFYDCPEEIFHWTSGASNHLSFSNQQEIYKGLLIITRALQHFPVINNNENNKESLSEELVHHIISYISEYDIKKIGANTQENSCFQRRIRASMLPPVSLMNHVYCISHYSLFALLRQLTFYKSKETNKYYVGWSPFFIELEEHFTPHIETHLALIKNTDLESTFKSINPFRKYKDITAKILCKGELLFLYFSGIDLDYNDFYDNCMEKYRVLSQKQIQQKASQLVHHTIDEKCIWCDLYRK